MHSLAHHLNSVLALLILLGDILDLQSCRSPMLAHHLPTQILRQFIRAERTWGQALLELLGLVGVLKDESVKVL